MTRVLILCLTLAVSCFLSSCTRQQDAEQRDDFKKYYDSFQVEGSFVLLDHSSARTLFYNQSQFNEPFSPASTFKICNSLIGLQTGVIPDENYVIPWDSVVRNPLWDADHDMKTAFQNSTVWYYQEVARRVGSVRMKHWLDAAHYGNADTTGGLDSFWLSGGLRISPKQQIEFLKALHDYTLPFSKRSIDIVKKMMIVKDTLGYVVRAKTGWGIHGAQDVGWFVGYVESKDKLYYFANCVQIKSDVLNDVKRAIAFDNSRTEIVYRILNELKITNDVR